MTGGNQRGGGKLLWKTSSCRGENVFRMERWFEVKSQCRIVNWRQVETSVVAESCCGRQAHAEGKMCLGWKDGLR